MYEILLISRNTVNIEYDSSNYSIYNYTLHNNNNEELFCKH